MISEAQETLQDSDQLIYQVFSTHLLYHLMIYDF